MGDIIVGGNMQSQVSNGEEPAIRLCEEHHADLLKQLGVHIDMHHQVFHILAVIAGKSMGTENLMRFKCPVCAMQEFDWIKEVVSTVTDNVKTPSLVVPS